MDPDASLLPRRAAAFLADVALLFLVLGPVGYLVQSLGEIRPETPREVYGILLLNFSVPVWTYFTLCDHGAGGATIGKRLLSLRVRTGAGDRVGIVRALGRTALKMLPWETAHAASFLFPSAIGGFGMASWIGLAISYALSLAWLFVAWRTAGRRSVHDVIVDTRVEQSA